MIVYVKVTCLDMLFPIDKVVSNLDCVVVVAVAAMVVDAQGVKNQGLVVEMKEKREVVRVLILHCKIAVVAVWVCIVVDDAVVDFGIHVVVVVVNVGDTVVCEDNTCERVVEYSKDLVAFVRENKENEVVVY